MRCKKSVFAGIVAVAASAYACFSYADHAAGAPCGLGPPPGSPQFAESEARQADEVKRTGFQSVCEGNLERYDIASGLRPLAVATAGLAFKPVDLANTPFAHFQSLGGAAESVGAVRSRLYRSFRTADGHIVTLFEDDMSADGSRVFRAPQDEPESINGLPARLVILQAGSGKAVSVLSWTEGRREYELWMNANVSAGPLRPQLFALAAALPKSVPARPQEPEPIPVRMGPDGFPVMPPLPAAIAAPR